MTDIKTRWQMIIEQRVGYDHPDYSVSDWKRDVLAGKTKHGYADCVSALLAVWIRQVAVVDMARISSLLNHAG